MNIENKNLKVKTEKTSPYKKMWGHSYWWYLQAYEVIQITFQNAQKEQKIRKGAIYYTIR